MGNCKCYQSSEQQQPPPPTEDTDVHNIIPFRKHKIPVFVSKTKPPTPISELQQIVSENDNRVENKSSILPLVEQPPPCVEISKELPKSQSGVPEPVSTQGESNRPSHPYKQVQHASQASIPGGKHILDQSEGREFEKQMSFDNAGSLKSIMKGSQGEKNTKKRVRFETNQKSKFQQARVVNRK